MAKMYVNDKTTNQNRATSLTSYLCIKSRWFQTAFFNIFLILVAICIFIIYSNSILLQAVTTSSFNNTKQLNTSLDSNLSVATMEITVKGNFPQIRDLALPAQQKSFFTTYLDTTFARFKSIVNETIINEYEQQLRDIGKQKKTVGLWKKQIVKRLETENQTLASIKKKIASESWVVSDTSFDLNKLCINYTWINKLLTVDTKPMYTTAYKKLNSTLAGMAEIEREARLNVSRLFNVSSEAYTYSNRYSMSRHDVKLINITSDGAEAGNNQSRHHSTIFMVIIGIIGGVAVLVQQIYTYFAFMESQKEANRIALDTSTYPDEMGVAYGIVDALIYRAIGGLFGSISIIGRIKTSWLVSQIIGTHSRTMDAGFSVLVIAVVHFFFRSNRKIIGKSSEVLKRKVWGITGYLTPISNTLVAGSDSADLQAKVDRVFKQAQSDLGNLLHRNGVLKMLTMDNFQLSKFKIMQSNGTRFDTEDALFDMVASDNYRASYSGLGGISRVVSKCSDLTYDYCIVVSGMICLYVVASGLYVYRHK